MRIYTLGTAHRKSYEFTRLLYKFGIQVVFDIRENPQAAEEHFCRGPLEQLCSSNGVSYVYLGNELGLSQSKSTGQQWLRNEAVQRALAIIAQKVPFRVCCILGSEASPERCPRRVLAEELARQGIEVVHLLDENTVWQPRVQPKSRSRPRFRGHRG